MRTWLPLVLLPLTACPVKPITEVGLTGTVFDGPASIDGVANANVEVRSWDGTLFDATVADPYGQFTIMAPAGQPAFMVVGGPDHVPTSFTVNIGTVDMVVPEQVIWARRASVHEALFTEFAGCSPEPPGGAVIEGEVRLYLGDVDEQGAEPLVTTGVVYVENEAGELQSGCYLDNAGTSAPDASLTGETGRYAIFNAPVGPAQLTVTYDTTESLTSTDLLVYVPEGGTVPGYPTYVALP